MGQRLVMLGAILAVAAAASATAIGSARRIPNWAAPQIATVVSHGLMGADRVRGFHPNRVLTRVALADLAVGLKQELTPEPAPPPATDPTPTTTTPTTTAPTGSTGTTTGSTDTTTGMTDTPATTGTTTGATTTSATTTGTTTTSTTTTTTTTGTTTGTTGTTTTGTTTAPNAPTATMAQLDRRLVTMLGLKNAAAEFAQGARAAGIAVPRRFGTEVVARLLGLRINHPAREDYLELRPQDTATRAEAAYSAAQILGFGWLADSWQLDRVKSLAKAFSLPSLTDWQRSILTVAFSKIGMPYVWGGTSDGFEVDFGVPARGGYDCSGFIWRVYKLQQYPNEGDLASTITGRTTYTMSVEVPRSERIPFSQLQPADVLFFGSRGPHSTGSQIVHTAIYVGNGWFIQSSRQGVALAQLTGWYRKKFAWARRPLREAGLES